MRTKNLYLCLLFLFCLGTTTVWADKYYMPGSYKSSKNRITLEEMLVPGTKFMIYNTAIVGHNGEDRTGFLRNDGNAFEHDKSKERDMFVYNESFVYTLEAYDSNGAITTDTAQVAYYAIKSISTGTYVDVLGHTTNSSADAAQLTITPWGKATAGKSGVKAEGVKYGVGDPDGNTSFLVQGKVLENDKEVTKYWNGNTHTFATWSDGHPYAFYVAHEQRTTDAGNSYLQDLHIYSRGDILSAQDIYGYVQLPENITTTATPKEGVVANLLDGDLATHITVEAGDSYTFNLGTTSTAIYLYLQQNADATNIATAINVEVSNDKASWTAVTGNPFATGLENDYFFASEKIELGGSYQYVRISNTTNAPMSFSEAYILPGCGYEEEEVAQAIKYIKAVTSAESVIYTKATALKYSQVIAQYNSEFPQAKLLSGVPVPGSKYRINADTYDVANQKRSNIEVKAADDNGEQLGREAAGTYHSSSAEDKKALEWYCELTPTGKYVFRSVAYPSLYLGNGVVTDERYEWSVNTSETMHFGVPLKNGNNQYLAVANDGAYWMGNVTSPQDQTVAPAYVDGDNNPETEATEVPKGLCTDFLFIPVPVDGDNEKKITFTASNIVQRNTRLMFDVDGDGTPEEQPLPFSYMFKKGEDLPTLELLCQDLHYFAGVKIGTDSVFTTKAVATDEGNVVNFNYDAMTNNDVLNICFTIEPPFEKTTDPLDTNQEPKFYFIKNLRPWESRQQARPRRAAATGLDIEIGGDEEDGPINMDSKNNYYAKFNTRGSNMQLVPVTGDEALDVLDATSLFFFTSTTKTEVDEYYSVMINNATTVMKCANEVNWNESGNPWFVQPHKTSSYVGYNIAQAALKGNKNDQSVKSWCSNHDNGDEIQLYGDANDDGTAWEFEEVDAEDARDILYNFIVEVAAELTEKLEARQAVAAKMGYDVDKITDYLYIVEQFSTRAEQFWDGTYTSNAALAGNNPTAKLLQFAQNIHMVEHEIEYALVKLPELTDEDKMDAASNFEHPRWYYVKNVATQRYAAYTTDVDAMNLTEAAGSLSNLFYISGTKNTYASRNPEYKDFPGNTLIVDEYLKAHIHNFDAVKKTIVSQNTVKLDVVPQLGDAGNGKSYILKVDSAQALTKDDNWCLELVYELDGLEQYNGYGSCLVSSHADPTKDDYTGAFQVFFKDNFDVVVKLNVNHDEYRFDHTQDAFTTIKIVITQAQGRTTIDVYNAKGDKKTVSKTGINLLPITALTSALPAKGATVKSLKISEVEAMTWMDRSTDKDVWYILPSSNTTNPGLAIVLDSPNDVEQGWTKVADAYTVGNDRGTQDNSTWQFVPVTDFDAHIEELLDKYNLSGCVIYDKEFAALLKLIKEKQKIITAQKDGGAVEEAAFNAVYDAIVNYTGNWPADLKAPKRGRLYTIRPLADEETSNALLAHVAAAKNGYSTTELYNGPSTRADGSIDTRAVWMFDGTEGADGFLSYNGLTLTNIHTRLAVGTLGSSETLLSATAAAVTLDANGDCTSFIKAGDKYMAINSLNYTDGSSFWGDALATYPAEIDNSIAVWKEERPNQNSQRVHCNSVTVVVPKEGNVTVTYRYVNGSKRLNMLGVTLVKDSEVVYSDYHFGYAGSYHRNNTYTMENVAPGTYTLNCYVGSDGLDEARNSGGYHTIDGASIEGATKLTNAGTENTRWIIEEIKNPEEAVFFPVEVATHGHSTLMLGFDAKIPAGIQAFWPRQHGPIGDAHYMSMTAYKDGIIPANTPVMLKVVGISSDPHDFEGLPAIATFKFNYSSTAASESTPDKLDGVLFGALYNTFVRCADYREGEGSHPDNHIYMLQKSQEVPRLYRIWENRNANGVKANPSTQDLEDGYIQCSPNKAYWVLPYDYTPAQNIAFSLRYDTWGGTTDIDEIEDVVENNGAADTIYDLQGRKIGEITSPGIYVVNGKKMIVK